jgi:hypothetical protein
LATGFFEIELTQGPSIPAGRQKQKFTFEYKQGKIRRCLPMVQKDRGIHIEKLSVETSARLL